jgi:hypothetical protein
VFATEEELARYMVHHGWEIDRGTTYEQWLAFIKSGGGAPDLSVDLRNGKVSIRTDVQAAAESSHGRP